MAESIMVADGDDMSRFIVKDILEKSGFDVYDVSAGKEALELFEECQDISLAVIDIMMPTVNGMEVLKVIRSMSDIPVVMITANEGLQSELEAFRRGANEYIRKPFNNDIFVERIKNLLKLRGADKLCTTEIGMIKIDPLSRKVFIDGNEVFLNNKEYQLLMLLIDNEQIVMSRETIINTLWGYDYEGNIRNIDTHVKMLRAKMGKAGGYIQTIWGAGYRFEVPATLKMQIV